MLSIIRRCAQARKPCEFQTAPLPKFQAYFRQAKPPLLAIWGKFDPYFIPAGVEAFRKDIPNATVTLLPTGHFALETHLEEIVGAMRDFLQTSQT